MKKREKIILVFLILMCLFFPLHQLSADSGWDGGYDSGGSSDWGSSSSDWGSSDWSSSDWSSSSGSYSSGSFDPVSFVIIMVVVLLFIYFVTVKANKGTGRSMVTSTTLGKVNPYDISKVRQFLPEFDEEAFKKKAYELYKEIQVAWMNFDQDTIRNCVTDELYHTYSSQLTALKVKKQINVMKNFKLLNSEIVGMEIKYDFIALTIKMKVECCDYVTSQDGKTLRGNDKQKVIYEYAMTFNKGVSDKPNKCPNCNAPLDDVNSSKCPYCDSSIINESYDWVLAKKQVLSQTINTKK